MKIIMIGGYPGSGKSVIVRELIKRLGYTFKENRIGLMKYIESGNMIILGSYAENELFPGTDRLPMNIQPEAERFLHQVYANEQAQHGKDRIVLFEGDRLFNDKMITFIKEEGMELVLCVVRASQVLIKSRRETRSEQNETWRKGRESKVDRIAMMYSIQHILHNDTKEEQDRSVEELLAEVKGEWKQESKQSKLKTFWS